jgi:glycosyltransferase involved in cell wall biosynthesis
VTRPTNEGAARQASQRPKALRFGMVGTYPPTECGIATFASALRGGMCGSERDSVECQIIRLVDQPQGDGGNEVLAELQRGSANSVAEAIAATNELDVVVVQHEYGIYGDDDGAAVLDIVEGITQPIIVVLHTVLDDPSPNQRRIIEGLAEHADALVTMTRTAQRRLRDYKVDMSKVSVIPHGAHPPAPDLGPAAATDRPTIMTWGLIGPGKGIEWGIEALSFLRDLDVKPRYLIVGKTHPNVQEKDGESYRADLEGRAAELGVDDLVEFDDSYHDRDDLQRMIAAAHVILLPYDSVDQVTSGVLIEAVAAGKAVISSSFPHAVELLGGGVGLLVPRHDSEAIANALRRVLTEPGLHERMVEGAEAVAPSLSWSAVGHQYRSLASSLLAARGEAVA